MLASLRDAGCDLGCDRWCLPLCGINHRPMAENPFGMARHSRKDVRYWETFHGLPGMLSDSLPDRFGNELINAWLARQGRTPESFNAVERLCYTGTRGMGALEFAPALGPVARRSSHLEISKLVELASEVLSHRDSLQGSFRGDRKEEALRDILRVGTSAGGARAKAVIAWNPETNEVRSGQVTSGAE